MVNHGGKSGEVAEGRDLVTSPGKTIAFILYCFSFKLYLLSL